MTFVFYLTTKGDEVDDCGLEGSKDQGKEEDRDAIISSRTDDIVTTDQNPAIPVESSAPNTPNGVEDNEENNKKRRVYVGNLAWEVSWQDLKDLMVTSAPESFSVRIKRVLEDK